MEKQDMRVLTLDPYQHGVVINAGDESVQGDHTQGQPDQ